MLFVLRNEQKTGLPQRQGKLCLILPHRHFIKKKKCRRSVIASRWKKQLPSLGRICTQAGIMASRCSPTSQEEAAQSRGAGHIPPSSTGVFGRHPLGRGSAWSCRGADSCAHRDPPSGELGGRPAQGHTGSRAGGQGAPLSPVPRRASGRGRQPGPRPSPRHAHLEQVQRVRAAGGPA